MVLESEANNKGNDVGEVENSSSSAPQEREANTKKTDANNTKCYLLRIRNRKREFGKLWMFITFVCS